MRDDKLLTRIGGLLRQAEGTENEHEAEAFMAAAQRLATAASIDLALARAHDPAARKATAPITRQITVGKAGKRGLRTYVQLFVQIAQANDVTCDVASNSTFVIAYGFETDIDTCEALYTSLVIQMVAASDAYLKSGAYKGETARQVVTKNVGYLRRRVVEEKALSPITARLNFQSAFAGRIGTRLREARDEQRAEASHADQRLSAGASSETTSTALVMRDKELEIKDFYKTASKARGTWRPTTATAGYSSAARRAGDRAGQRAKIGADREFGGVRGALES
ncbi:DUF2786 domain-containing protein [Gordonia sp. (in: high G+C Gram-positive bacteria)]|uniref:DUF2786 domain-containing protein n=1 Tax=Gordonia sp. (in: high G+C Gram-positive bacteria) TaxID=84139 RepID=UPI00169F83B0|nr:DUF2786 domain-containing protein [Gordonia sp. (in: high G+C Gram-positive bacteria)]NLG47557.1 DUF2786 domain-containing protein [Gordonia sp. (in: high G+C Gram-positive bacteria)]